MKLPQPIILGLTAVTLFMLGAVLSPTKISEASDGGSVSCRAGSTVQVDSSGTVTCVASPDVTPGAIGEVIAIPDQTTDTTSTTAPTSTKTTVAPKSACNP